MGPGGGGGGVLTCGCLSYHLGFEIPIFSSFLVLGLLFCLN